MKGRFPYAKLLKYPHLGADEAKIYDSFVETHPGFFDSVDFDIHVGEARKFPGQPTDKITKGMEELSRKRIDFVGYKNDEIWIGEIKPNALLGAFGQLMGEKDLYIDEFKPKKEPKMILLTGRENPDMRKLASKFGVAYFVAPAAIP